MESIWFVENCVATMEVRIFRCVLLLKAHLFILSNFRRTLWKKSFAHFWYLSFASLFALVTATKILNRKPWQLWQQPRNRRKALRKRPLKWKKIMYWIQTAWNFTIQAVMRQKNWIKAKFSHPRRNSGWDFFAKILVKSIYLCYNRCATQLNQQTFHGIALYFYEGFLTMPFFAYR